MVASSSKEVFDENILYFISPSVYDDVAVVIEPTACQHLSKEHTVH
jgi:hypothetical protein